MLYLIARRLLAVTVLTGTSLLAVAAAAQEARPAADTDSGSQVSVQAEKLSEAQLADLVAPLALYPDSLLSQVFVACTYPLEVVEAEQWLRRNGELKGHLLTDAAREKDWDPSVQGLVAFPDVLTMLNQDVKWTAALGNAFLAQQPDVMAAVQRMRARARASGKLASTPQQTVTTETKDGETVIEVAPADPQVIYVPEYDPVEIWGPPAYESYPALAYAPYFGFGPAMDIGFWFGPWDGWGWGWGPNWWGRSVWINSGFFNHYGFHGYRGHRGGYGDRDWDGGRGGRPGGPHSGQVAGIRTWRHDPIHRQGVPYANGRVAPRLQGASFSPRTWTQRSGGLSTQRSDGWRESGRTVSPYGNRMVAPGSRTVERSFSRRIVPRPTEGQTWRAPQGAAQERFVRRNPPSVPRLSATEYRNRTAPRYEAAPRMQSAPRSYSYAPHAGGGGRGAGGSFSRPSGGGGGPSVDRGHGSSGGSHGGGGDARRH